MGYGHSLRTSAGIVRPTVRLFDAVNRRPVSNSPRHDQGTRTHRLAGFEATRVCSACSILLLWKFDACRVAIGLMAGERTWIERTCERRGGILRTSHRKPCSRWALRSQPIFAIGVAADHESPRIVTDSHEWSAVFGTLCQSIKISAPLKRCRRVLKDSKIVPRNGHALVVGVVGTSVGVRTRKEISLDVKSTTPKRSSQIFTRGSLNIV